MKKILAVLLAAMVAVSVFAGCGFDGPEATQAPSAAPTETAPATTEEEGTPEPGVITKVALVTDGGSVEDGAMNQACWQGVESWCSANGIACTYYQPTEDSDDARVISVAQAIAEGANAVVMPGTLFGETIRTVQDEYVDVYFIVVDVTGDDLAVQPSASVACLAFAGEQAGYLAGYAAVREGYTKLGFLGAMEGASIARYGYGFVQGADAAAVELGVDIEINYSYQMEAWYQGGTEIIFACGGDVCGSVLEAARSSGCKVIGVDVDPSSDDSGCLLTSVRRELRGVTETVLEALNNGQWTAYGGKVSNFSLTEGGYVGLNTDIWTMEKFSVEEYEALKGQIADGTIVVDGSTGAMPVTSEHTTVHEID